jgi:4-amino-4-deoxy-L-arabinose transferase-like glycosyltransferase
MSVATLPPVEHSRPAAPALPRTGLARRLWRGRPSDPAWVRPALLSLIAATAVAYTWGLGASGYANSFYAAAVQAGTKSWKAFFFGSFDAANFITVDKSPAALWVMELSGRIFGFNSWSMLVPEALEGVGTVAFVYLTVRRWFAPGAALVAGAATALTPVAALMFRFNNPDALMVLLITASAYATVRAIEDGRSRWLVLAGTLVGFAFLAKMLQAMLVVPGLGLAYLVAAPGSVGRRARQLLYGGAAIAVAAGWWIMAVELTPAADRPYVGGSQDNSLWNLIFGYNGFGRLTGNETGSVGGGASPGGNWGPTGLTRLFGAEMGTQVSWLLPAALILLVAGLLVTRRARRTNRTRAALILWGSWLVLTGLAFSLGKGIIHPYYTVALAPAIGGLIGVGGALMWSNRDRFAARAVLAAAAGVTAVWAYVLLDRTPAWMPWLRSLILLAGALAVAGILGWGVLHGRARSFTAAAVVAATLLGPLAYTIDTVRTPHSGAIPSAGPVGASTGAGGFPGRAGGGLAGGRFAGGPSPGGGVPGGNNSFAGGPSPGGGAPGGNGSVAGNGTGPGRTGFGGGAGAAGGLLNASKPSAALTAVLRSDASRYTWVAATVGANDAAGYQLATGDPVMAIGGFNGTDPYPSLSYFEALVAAGKVHYFIGGGTGGGGFAGAAGGSSTANAIETWVESHFQSTTVDGVTFYNLSARSS